MLSIRSVIDRDQGEPDMDCSTRQIVAEGEEAILSHQVGPGSSEWFYKSLNGESPIALAKNHILFSDPDLYQAEFTIINQRRLYSLIIKAVDISMDGSTFVTANEGVKSCTTLSIKRRFISYVIS